MATFRCGSVSEMACGSVREVNVGGRRIALARGEDGVYHALDNMCAHQGGPLGQGYIDGEALVCPLHGFSYRLDDGSCTMLPALKVPTIPVRVEGDDVFVELPDL